MKQIAWRAAARDVKGTTTLEFAFVSTILVAMLLGAMELGLMMWTRGTLQAIAAQTARCAALSSPICNNSATTPATTPLSYAANLATTLLGSGAVSTNNVTITTGTTCLNETGGPTTFEIVKITVTPWVGVSRSGWFATGYGSLAPLTETVTGCYPT